MARFKDRAKALEFRQQGMSYSQIKTLLNVSKSTLSAWLKEHPLSQKRMRELQFTEGKIEKYRETMRLKRESRLSNIYETQQKEILPLNKRELLIAGLFLYWGEGRKTGGQLAISNTDPAIIAFFIHWLKKCFGIENEKIKVHLHLYADMDIEKETQFWSNYLKISKSQFIKPYIKRTSSDAINHRGGFGHGTCNLGVNNARLAEKALMSIKVIANTCL